MFDFYEDLMKNVIIMKVLLRFFFKENCLLNLSNQAKFHLYFTYF
jgi:hypothetical protein